MKRVFLTSGGIDSYIAWFLTRRLGDIALFVDYGQVYNAQEKKAVMRLIPGVNVITIDGRATEIENNYIPNRNLLLATIAATYCYPDEIIIAGLASDNCLDKTEAVFAEYSNLLSIYSKKEIVVSSPFWQQSKADIVRLFLKNGGDEASLLLTYSCYLGYETACGKCKACIRRKRFLENII